MSGLFLRAWASVCSSLLGAFSPLLSPVLSDGCRAAPAEAARRSRPGGSVLIHVLGIAFLLLTGVLDGDEQPVVGAGDGQGVGAGGGEGLAVAPGRGRRGSAPPPPPLRRPALPAPLPPL